MTFGNRKTDYTCDQAANGMKFKNRVCGFIRVCKAILLLLVSNSRRGGMSWSALSEWRQRTAWDTHFSNGSFWFPEWHSDYFCSLYWFFPCFFIGSFLPTPTDKSLTDLTCTGFFSSCLEVICLPWPHLSFIIPSYLPDTGRMIRVDSRCNVWWPGLSLRSACLKTCKAQERRKFLSWALQVFRHASHRESWPSLLPAIISCAELFMTRRHAVLQRFKTQLWYGDTEIYIAPIYYVVTLEIYIGAI